MDVQDAAGIRRNDAGAQHGQKACQHHQVDLMRFQDGQQGGVKSLAVGIVLAADHRALHACLGGPLQRVDAGLGGHHQFDLSVGVLAPGFAVQQGLQVGAAAGDEHCNVQHSSTPSPSAMTPRR